MIPDISNYMIEWFLLLSLILLSWIDIKKREFPAPLTTGVLLVVVLTIPTGITFGLIAFIVGWFLMEMEFFSGGADLKLITAMGVTMPNLGFLFIMIILTLIFGTVYKALHVKLLKKAQTEEIAFIPVFFFVYVALLLIQIL